MDLHGLIEKVGALGAELEHEIATEARRAWTALREELEKLRPHAHPTTGVITLDENGKPVLPEPPTPTAQASNESFAAAGAPAPGATAAPAPEDAPAGGANAAPAT